MKKLLLLLTLLVFGSIHAMEFGCYHRDKLITYDKKTNTINGNLKETFAFVCKKGPGLHYLKGNKLKLNSNTSFEFIAIVSNNILNAFDSIDEFALTTLRIKHQLYNDGPASAICSKIYEEAIKKKRIHRPFIVAFLMPKPSSILGFDEQHCCIL